MTFTAVPENDYKFSVLAQDSKHIAHTNGTTRTLKFRELVCVTDALSQVFVGIVAERAGIAAGATGRVDLMEGREIATNQFTAGAFVAGDVGVFIVPQTNGSQALITQATAVGSVPLNALIISYNASETIRLRMPYQAGTAVAAS